MWTFIALLCVMCMGNVWDEQKKKRTTLQRANFLIFVVDICVGSSFDDRTLPQYCGGPLLVFSSVLTSVRRRGLRLDLERATGSHPECGLPLARVTWCWVSVTGNIACEIGYFFLVGFWPLKAKGIVLVKCQFFYIYIYLSTYIPLWCMCVCLFCLLKFISALNVCGVIHLGIVCDDSYSLISTIHLKSLHLWMYGCMCVYMSSFSA